MKNKINTVNLTEFGKRMNELHRVRFCRNCVSIRLEKLRCVKFNKIVDGNQACEFFVELQHGDD